jgi:beta-1,4-mannosyltransferase
MVIIRGSYLSDRSSKIIAIKPVSDPNNSFTRLFSDAVARQGYAVRDFGWKGIERGGVDAVIFHWPFELLGIGGFKGILPYLKNYGRLRKARARGTRIIWIAHDARPHDGGRLSALLMQRFLRLIDGILYLSHHSAELIGQLYAVPERIVQATTVHGHYVDVMETPVQSPPQIGERVQLAFFGQIRRYKNVEKLAEIVAGVPLAMSLAIAGRRSHEDIAVQLEAIATSAANIALDLRMESLPDADIERLVDGAQGIVLPYRAILNSGAAIFALSRGRPVLAPNIGSLPELQAIVGSEWLQLYDGDISAAHVKRFADWLRNRPPIAQPDLSALSWDRVGRDVAGLIDRLPA